MKRYTVTSPRGDRSLNLIAENATAPEAIASIREDAIRHATRKRNVARAIAADPGALGSAVGRSENDARFAKKIADEVIRENTGRTIMVKDVSGKWVVHAQEFAVELRHQGWSIVVAEDCESDIASPPLGIAYEEGRSPHDHIRDAISKNGDIIRSRTRPDLPGITSHDLQGATAVVLTNGSMSVYPPGTLGYWLSSMGD